EIVYAPDGQRGVTRRDEGQISWRVRKGTGSRVEDRLLNDVHRGDGEDGSDWGDGKDGSKRWLYPPGAATERAAHADRTAAKGTLGHGDPAPKGATYTGHAPP